MKTNQIMTRNLGGFEIQQRTQDGFFDLNALAIKWNETHPDKRKKDVVNYLEKKETKEFIKALAIDESHIQKNVYVESQLVSKVSGRYYQGGRTPDRIWAHPLIFVDFAMWLNPTFKVQVLRFVADKMLEFRDEAGEAYKQLSSAVAKIVEKNQMRAAMQKVGEALNYIVFGNHEKMMRNKQGEEKKMRELFELERKVADLIEEGFIRNFTTLVTYLQNQWRRKYTPEVFSQKKATSC